MRNAWRARVRALLTRRRPDRDLDDEMRDHLEHQIAWHRDRGASEADATRQALVDLGGLEALKERCRDERRAHWLDDLQRDVRYAVRALYRRPGFASAAIVSLALGIGANTVVFGLLNAFVLKPLPIRDPDRVVFVSGGRFNAHSYPNYRDLRDRATTIAGLAGFRFAPMGVRGATSSEQAWGYLVAGNYFDVLGVRPLLGRLLSAQDDVAPGASPVVVLAHSYWLAHFAGDPSIVGRTLTINTRGYTVVGVAPPGFRGTERFFQPDLWVPLAMQGDIEGYRWMSSRQSFNLQVVGRLADGVTPAKAEANLNAIAADLAREYPADDAGLFVRVTRPGWLGDQLGAPVSAFTRGLMALAMLVLFATCANLASLLAARATDRGRELAIRLSIGAGRARIARQLMTEALVLAGSGGAAGAALAGMLLGALSRWRSVPQFPVGFDVAADWRVFVFALAAATTTGVMFGIAPARLAWRTNLAHAWKGGLPSSSRRRWNSRDVLVAVQIAVCGTLVIGAVVAGRELHRELAAPLGIRPNGVDVVGFDLGLARYDKAQGRALHQHALEALRALPGVTAAAYADTLPLNIDQSSETVFDEHATDTRMDHATTASYYTVSPGYLAAIGTRLLYGRDFTDGDREGAPSVAIVNQTFARRVLGRAGAVGARFRSSGDAALTEVIGIVEDGKYSTLFDDPRPAFFVPELQHYSSNTLLIARHAPGTASLATDLQRVVSQLDPDIPIYASGTADRLVGFAFLPGRVATIALAAFGGLALMLALTGTYGVAAYAVSRRAREIGIRMAIGARPVDVLRAMLGRVIVLLGVGALAGVVVALLASRVLAAVIHDGAAIDLVTLAAMAVVMVIVGLAATWIPARRALRIDPVNTLRAE